jgi:3-methyladenine DNA glycosylase AlkD
MPAMAGAEEAFDRITTAFERARDPERAAPMAAYMRNQFPFLGIPSPEQRRLARDAMAGIPAPSQGELADIVSRLWEMPEREYQYAACGLVARHIRACDAAFIDVVKRLLTTKSWWDTVDSLAKGGAGALVLLHPRLVEVMDTWIDDGNMWLRRTALLHQLGYRERTDAGRLFRYCEKRAGEQEFFIRKAIGWALRQHARVDPEWVRGFVAEHEDRMSGLTRREATKHLS